MVKVRPVSSPSSFVLPPSSFTLILTPMPRLTRTLRIVLAGLAVALALPAALRAQAGGIAVGASMPTGLTLETLDGKPMPLADAIGKKPAVIEFWATWCPLCRKLEPAMQAARTRYGKEVAFIGIGVPDNQTAERQQQFVRERGMQGMFLFDKESAAVKAFASPHTSYVVVLDAAGKVVYTGVGGEQDIDAAVKRALPTR